MTRIKMKSMTPFISLFSIIDQRMVVAIKVIDNQNKEIVDLKLTVLRKLTPTGKKVISLKGILKGVDVTEEDVTSAKKSLYSKIGI